MSTVDVWDGVRLSPASDDNPLPVRIASPTPLVSANLSGAITEANSFQVIQEATTTRRGGLIQNQKYNSGPMWVFVGPVAEASKESSFFMQPGDPPFSCLVGIAGVMTDEISITGAQNERFFALFQ